MTTLKISSINDREFSIARNHRTLISPRETYISKRSRILGHRYSQSIADVGSDDLADMRMYESMKSTQKKTFRNFVSSSLPSSPNGEIY
jgi:hypothetical protein